MVCIVKKKKKGRLYYYAVQSGRVNGKPRIVWQKYLGTAEGILRRMEQGKPPRPKEAVILEIGGVAALSRIAQRLGLLEILDQNVPKRNQGPSVGHYLLLATLNRALEPVSKRKIGKWYEGTILPRWWGFPAKAFSSQRFWDHMDLVGEDEIRGIEEDVARAVVEEFGLELETLFYDTTNFFTYISSFNDRSTLAKRGKCKAHRNNLRIIGLALLVAGPFHVPVLHRTYPGNLNDATQFKVYSLELSEALERIAGASPEVTLVFDKGNHSPEAFEEIFDGPCHFVAAVKPSEHPHLLEIPLKRYEFPAGEEWPGLRVCRDESLLYGRPVTVALTFSESFFTQQLAGVTRELTNCVQKLTSLSHGLGEWRAGKRKGKKPTRASVEKRVSGILSPQHMKKLIDCEIGMEKGIPKLAFATNHEALEQLSRVELGRTFIATDHRAWDTSAIIRACRGQHHVEDAFKEMNHLEFLRFRPQHHWTDQKVAVHALYCVLALTLTSLLRRELARGGLDLSTPDMLTQLGKIKEVAVIYPPGTLAHPRDHVTLSRTSKKQKRMIEILDLESLLPPRR